MAFLRKHRSSFAIYILVVVFLFSASQAQSKDSIRLYEQEIKAGLLYNFLKYTNWPSENLASESNVMSLCIFGEDPFSGYLQPMEGRSVNQRIIKIRNVNSLNALADCNMLFVNSEEESSWPKLREYLSGKNILTVSDISGFTSYGGMIEFTRNDERVSIKLNQSAIKTTKLSVQDRLLKLATVVSGNKEGGR